MSELKPCIYCGGEAEIEYDYDGNEYESWEWYDLVFNHKENCIYNYQAASFNTKEELIDACNKRTPSPELKAVYEKYISNMEFKKGKVRYKVHVPVTELLDSFAEICKAVKNEVENG